MGGLERRRIDRFRESRRGATAGATFLGVPIEELGRDDLLAVVDYLIAEGVRGRDETARRLDLIAGITATD